MSPSPANSNDGERFSKVVFHRVVYVGGGMSFGFVAVGDRWKGFMARIGTFLSQANPYVSCNEWAMSWTLSL